MKAKTIIVLATLLAFGQGAWAQTSSFPETDDEKGTEAKPFLIENIEDLNALASDVNSGTDYSGKHFKLTADLTFTAPVSPETSNFTPIGKVEYRDDNETPLYEEKAFKGVFDGGEKTISGIVVNTSDAEAVGLFGNVFYPGIIKNVKMTNCSFTGNYCVGAICGECNGGSAGEHKDVQWGIFDCEVGSNVTVTAATSGEGEDALPGWYAGGIVGDLKVSRVTGCISAATVSGAEYVGGIAGSISHDKDAAGSPYGSLTDCFYTGNSVTATENKYAGTIVGLNGSVDDDDNLTDGTAGKLVFTLLDNDSEAAINNATRLSNYDDLEANVTLSGRTLYKDNSWNTICLPFAMTAEQVTAQLAPTKLMTLSTATFDDGTLTLNFADATEIEAGKPYIIKWTGNTEWGNPTFTGVTVSSAAPTDVTGTAANFHGIYTPYSTGGENKSMLYLGAENKIYYPNADMTINAFRAYFTLNNGITVGDLPQQARAFVLNFGDGDETTGIISIDNGQLIIDNSMDAWYSLDGRRLTGKPSRAGVYINNGKKIVIK